MKMLDPSSIENKIKFYIKLMNLPDMNPYYDKMKAISASSSRIDLGRMIPSSNNILSTADSDTIKNSWKSFFSSCSLMYILNQLNTEFQKYFSLILQLYNPLNKILHYFKL